ncbi:SusD/RagB family nutrient-binding outer membrane lipoprotein [Rapidithrix thailandica]|uniref:SusD/RagB family nutrient-binding outer membrane lipoprotein n=1 Tax=Rapidithrix thailandica TaxID=413964 RepID=A0AAW9RX35_9BACT
MKPTKNSIYILLLTVLGFSCNLEELDVNPNSPTEVAPGPLFTNVLLRTAGETGTSRRGSIGYCMMMVQQTATLKTDDLEGDKYLASNNVSQLFNFTYSTLAKNIEAVIAMVKEDPAQANLYGAIRIWKVLVYHRVTDLYGDVPYFEAGAGYNQQVYFPKYDAQEEIYMHMLKELEEASALLATDDQSIADADFIYDGDIARWKRLANSLMLRLAMRLVKKDPAKAEEWTKKALAGGVMDSNADDCMIRHESTREVNSNPAAFAFFKFDLVKLGDIKISKTLMDYLKQTGDPRISVYCSLPDGDSDPAMQKGLPNGYDITTIDNFEPSADLTTFSNPNIASFLDLSAPTVLLTWSETELLRAEAAARGWTGENAAEHYAKGLEASMKQQAVYGEAGMIEASAITGFITANPYPSGGTLEEQLRQINVQYWVATFMNGFESYANWRRTGYPELVPVNYNNNASNGTIPRRLMYPIAEYSANGSNLKTAIDRQGVDKFTTRIWWDQE